MSQEVLNYLKGDVDSVKSELKALSEKLGQVTRIVEGPGGKQICFGDLCYKLEDFNKGLQDLDQRIGRIEEEFQRGKNASVGDLLASDPKAKGLVRRIALEAAANVAKPLDDETIEEKIKAVLNRMRQEQETDKPSGKGRFYDLFLAHREANRR